MQMHLNQHQSLNLLIQSRMWNQQGPRTLLERAQAYLDAGLGTPESRDIILGLLLANGQLKETVAFAEEILVHSMPCANHR
jgi:hypothetical protein